MIFVIQSVVHVVVLHSVVRTVTFKRICDYIVRIRLISVIIAVIQIEDEN